MREKPRKFRVSIYERVIQDGSEAHGSGYSKTVDLDDVKEIYELLKKAASYSEKYGQGVKRTKNLVL